MGETLLTDLFKIFALAVVVLYVCHRFRVPSIVGFLLTGIIAGPHGFGLVTSVEQVETIAELGVVILLFSIGIEFSFKELMDIRRTVLLGGSVHVLLTIMLTALIAHFFAIPIKSAIFLGFLVSLSSTAIVLKQLGERAELASPHGKVDLGILIYQDIIVVAMMIFTPLLGTGTMNDPVGMLLAKAAGVIVLVILLANYLVPPLLFQVIRTGSRELFLLCIFVICFGVAWLTSSAGLSLALGAFLAGLIIAESEYSHQAIANIIPFIDTFTSLFFVSIGMLLNISVLLEHLEVVLFLTILLMIAKALVGVLATLVLGYPLRTSILVGLALCQIGEFSFILSQTGLEHQVISQGLYQGFLSAAILSMMLTPFLISLAPAFAERMLKLPLPEKLKSGKWNSKGILNKNEETDHLIIVGYGVNGRNVARAASIVQIPYRVVEMNADTVKKEKKVGVPIFFGDATQEIVLEMAGLESARMMVIAIHDAAATRRIISLSRKINPGIHILVRTRFVKDILDLEQLGANEVIPEEYETSIEIFSRVLARYLIPEEEIKRVVQQIRKQDYDMFRNLGKASLGIQSLNNLYLTDVDIKTIRVGDHSIAIGKKLQDIDLRSQYGVSLLAIRRGANILSNPGADDQIEEGDELVLMGSMTEINELVRQLL